MNTRELILNLLSKSEEPLNAKGISFELGKSSADIRKILSNLSREGKIKKVAYGQYASVNVSVNESVNVELAKEAKNTYNAYFRKYYAKHPEKRKERDRKYWLKKTLELKETR
jgi:predicted transcriptional regulator